MSRNLPDRLWNAIDPTFKQILEHPFITGLTDGTLDQEAFRFYVVQDALYLRDYARALALCAAKSPDEESIQMFAEHAAGAIAVERSLHDSFFEDFELSQEEVRTTRMASTTLAYTSYLLATAGLGSFAEALGAVLPCYWIYWEVGKVLLEHGSPNPLYQRWIDTYGGDEFAAVVRAVLDLTERIGLSLGPDEEAKLTAHFVATARFEWMFWDMALRREEWPV
jgi:thiaminase/transcriptional activator TenA